MSKGGDYMSHHKEANRISLHPGFVSAMELELKEDAEYLVFDSEHELNKEPLSIDLLIIKKNPEVTISNELGAYFKGYNILEYKSEEDGLSIDDVMKTIGYACL